MNLFRNLNIRYKLSLIQIVTITVSSILVGAGIYYLQLEDATQKKLEGNQALARIISYNVLPAMEFLDENVANEVLSTVKDVSQIDQIIIKESNGEIFANYSRVDEKITYPEFKDQKIEQIFTETHLFTKHVIESKDKKLGTLVLTTNLSDLQKTKNNFFKVLVIGLTSIIILSIILMSIVQGAITKPIHALLLGVQKVSETQDYKIRIKKFGTDEIGKLTEKTNHLISVVEKQNHILSEDNKKLDKLVKRRTVELQEANEKLEEHLLKLEETNNELSKFVYIVSHDLKAPLRAISTLSSFIEEDIGEDVNEEVKANLVLVRQRAERMQLLIEALLKYSRTGKAQKDITQFELSELYSELRGIFNEDKNYEIHFNLNQPISIEADRLLLQQVLQNLIQNAIKYNDKDVAQVDINFEEDDSFYKFEVKDNGMGIDAKFHDQIFDVFKTLQSRDEVESTGIGLSIVKRIVEDNGGDIKVESELGKGSKFIFSWKKS